MRLLSRNGESRSKAPKVLRNTEWVQRLWEFIAHTRASAVEIEAPSDEGEDIV